MPENKHKKYRFSIRVGIVLVFVSIFLVMSLLILSLVAWRAYANAVVLTNQVTAALSTSVLREVTAQLNPTLAASRLSAQLIESGTIDPEQTEQILKYTQKILAVLNAAQNCYWGNEQGDFIISRREPDGTISSEVIHRSHTPMERYRLDRDAYGKVIKKTPIEKMDYDPRERPWYKTAKAAKESTWSPAYVFYSGAAGTLGITSVTPVYNDELRGVVGIDVKLQAIAAFLEKIYVSENGKVFIVNKEANLIAYNEELPPLTHISKINNPEVYGAYKAYLKHNTPYFTYRSNNYKYHAAVLAVPGLERNNWRLFIVVPDKDITGPIWRANYQTSLIVLLLMFFGIIFISYLSSRISKPIRELAGDLERVRVFDIRLQSILDTRVKEVFLMSEAIFRMKIGLLSFKKYVPRGIVQILIEQGEAAKLGGKQREITLMFTDVENFTSIAEQASAESIMIHMCEYFDVIGETIQNHHGIVDKFIGDAVMAFWGAPEIDDNQSYNSCVAALECQEKLDVANENWRVRGLQQLPTRIGIHRGEAIVGNLGSHERLNYTAIGDVVNISNRLESLNKVYGTRIIASDEIFSVVREQFIFRLLDRVVVKGRQQANNIYQLLARRTPEEEQKYNPLVQNFENALSVYRSKNFEEAQKLFQAILDDYPNDKPSALFVERCQYFIQNGVKDGWDGVWVYTQKDTQR